jgi:tetratricopeptide (TPR) repeat protein
MAMREGLRPLDEAALEAASVKRLERARFLESQGLAVEAERAYREVGEDFPGSETAELAGGNAERLRASDSYIRALRSETRLQERERARLKRFWELIQDLSRPREDPSEAFRLQTQFGVDRLLQDAQRAEDAGERDLACRLLAWLESNAGDLGMSFHARRNYGPAVELVKLAGRASGGSPRWLYNLACAYSRAGAKRDALRALESAVKNGFVNVELMLRDADLESIRNEPAFKSLLQRMR